MEAYPHVPSRVDGDLYQAYVPDIVTVKPQQRVSQLAIETNAKNLPFSLVNNQQMNTWNPIYDSGANFNEVDNFVNYVTSLFGITSPYDICYNQYEQMAYDLIGKHHGDVKAARFELDCSTSGSISEKAFQRVDLDTVLVDTEKSEILLETQEDDTTIEKQWADWKTKVHNFQITKEREYTDLISLYRTAYLLIKISGIPNHFHHYITAIMEYIKSFTTWQNKVQDLFYSRTLTPLALNMLIREGKHLHLRNYVLDVLFNVKENYDSIQYQLQFIYNKPVPLSVLSYYIYNLKRVDLPMPNPANVFPPLSTKPKSNDDYAMHNMHTFVHIRKLEEENRIKQQLLKKMQMKKQSTLHKSQKNSSRSDSISTEKDQKDSVSVNNESTKKTPKDSESLEEKRNEDDELSTIDKPLSFSSTINPENGSTINKDLTTTQKENTNKNIAIDNNIDTNIDTNIDIDIDIDMKNSNNQQENKKNDNNEITSKDPQNDNNDINIKNSSPKDDNKNEDNSKDQVVTNNNESNEEVQIRSVPMTRLQCRLAEELKQQQQQQKEQELQQQKEQEQKNLEIAKDTSNSISMFEDENTEDEEDENTEDEEDDEEDEEEDEDKEARDALAKEVLDSNIITSTSMDHPIDIINFDRSDVISNTQYPVTSSVRTYVCDDVNRFLVPGNYKFNDVLIERYDSACKLREKALILDRESRTTKLLYSDITRLCNEYATINVIFPEMEYYCTYRDEAKLLFKQVSALRNQNAQLYIDDLTKLRDTMKNSIIDFSDEIFIVEEKLKIAETWFSRISAIITNLESNGDNNKTLEALSQLVVEAREIGINEIGIDDDDDDNNDNDNYGVEKVETKPKTTSKRYSRKNKAKDNILRNLQNGKPKLNYLMSLMNQCTKIIQPPKEQSDKIQKIFDEATQLVDRIHEVIKTPQIVDELDDLVDQVHRLPVGIREERVLSQYVVLRDLLVKVSNFDIDDQSITYEDYELLCLRLVSTHFYIPNELKERYQLTFTTETELKKQMREYKKWTEDVNHIMDNKPQLQDIQNLYEHRPILRLSIAKYTRVLKYYIDMANEWKELFDYYDKGNTDLLLPELHILNKIGLRSKKYEMMIFDDHDEESTDNEEDEDTSVMNEDDISTNETTTMHTRNSSISKVKSKTSTHPKSKTIKGNHKESDVWEAYKPYRRAPKNRSKTSNGSNKLNEADIIYIEDLNGYEGDDVMSLKTMFNNSAMADSTSLNEDINIQDNYSINDDDSLQPMMNTDNQESEDITLEENNQDLQSPLPSVDDTITIRYHNTTKVSSKDTVNSMNSMKNSSKNDSISNPSIEPLTNEHNENHQDNHQENHQENESYKSKSLASTQDNINTELDTTNIDIDMMPCDKEQEQIVNTNVTTSDMKKDLDIEQHGIQHDIQHDIQNDMNSISTIKTTLNSNTKSIKNSSTHDSMNIDTNNMNINDSSDDDIDLDVVDDDKQSLATISTTTGYDASCQQRSVQSSKRSLSMSVVDELWASLTPSNPRSYYHNLKYAVQELRRILSRTMSVETKDVAEFLLSDNRFEYYTVRFFNKSYYKLPFVMPEMESLLLDSSTYESFIHRCARVLSRKNTRKTKKPRVEKPFSVQLDKLQSDEHLLKYKMSDIAYNLIKTNQMNKEWNVQLKEFIDKLHDKYVKIMENNKIVSYSVYDTVLDDENLYINPFSITCKYKPLWLQKKPNEVPSTEDVNTNNQNVASTKESLICKIPLPKHIDVLTTEVKNTNENKNVTESVTNTNKIDLTTTESNEVHHNENLPTEINPSILIQSDNEIEENKELNTNSIDMNENNKEIDNKENNSNKENENKMNSIDSTINSIPSHKSSQSIGHDSSIADDALFKDISNPIDPQDLRDLKFYGLEYVEGQKKIIPGLYKINTDDITRKEEWERYVAVRTKWSCTSDDLNYILVYANRLYNHIQLLNKTTTKFLLDSINDIDEVLQNKVTNHLDCNNESNLLYMKSLFAWTENFNTIISRYSLTSIISTANDGMTLRDNGAGELFSDVLGVYMPVIEDYYNIVGDIQIYNRGHEPYTPENADTLCSLFAVLHITTSYQRRFRNEYEVYLDWKKKTELALSSKSHSNTMLISTRLTNIDEFIQKGTSLIVRNSKLICSLTKEKISLSMLSIKPAPVDAKQPLYCVCRTPEDSGEMIQCDKCTQWYHLSCMLLNDTLLPDTYLCVVCKLKEIILEKRRKVFLNASEFIPTIVNQNTIPDFLIRIDDTIPAGILNIIGVPNFEPFDFEHTHYATNDDKQLFFFTGHTTTYTIATINQWIQCSLLFISHYNSLFKNTISRQGTESVYPKPIKELQHVAEVLGFCNTPCYQAVMDCYNTSLWFYACMRVFTYRSYSKLWNIADSMSNLLSETNEVSIYINTVYKKFKYWELQTRKSINNAETTLPEFKQLYLQGVSLPINNTLLTTLNTIIFDNAQHHCICKSFLTDYNDFILCTKCSSLYHPRCVKVKASSNSAISSFVCPDCKYDNTMRKRIFEVNYDCKHKKLRK